MTLTNKTLEHFLEWKVNNKNLSTIEVLDFKYLSTISQNALIIEFFDSVGIYIEIKTDVYTVTGFGNKCDYYIKVGKKMFYDEMYKTRQEATIQAITKANDIYNNTYKV